MHHARLRPSFAGCVGSQAWGADRAKGARSVWGRPNPERDQRERKSRGGLSFGAQGGSEMRREVRQERADAGRTGHEKEPSQSAAYNPGRGLAWGLDTHLKLRDRTGNVLQE